MNKLTCSDNHMCIQPISVNSKFVFEDSEILHKMEKYHVVKDVTQSIDNDMERKLQHYITEAMKCNHGNSWVQKLHIMK